MGTSREQPRDYSEDPPEDSRPGSSRLILSKRVLEEKHPCMRYLKDAVPQKIEQNPDDPLWQTISALMRCQKRITVRFPFTNEKVGVVLSTYFKTLYQGMVKKGRVPDETGYYNMALQTTASRLMTSTSGEGSHLITDPMAILPIEAIEETINTSKDPFIIRTNNTFATEELDKTVWEPFIRKKIELPEHRLEAIPTVSESDAMLYLLVHAFSERELSDIERLHLYLLLIDPSQKGKEMRFSFLGQEIHKRVREVMSGAISYPTGITYYSPQVDENLRRDLIKTYAGKAYDRLIGSAFKCKRPRAVNTGLIVDMRTNLDRLLAEEGRMAFDDLEPLRHPEGDDKPLKVPNSGMEAVQKRIEGIQNSNHLCIFGQLSYWASEQAA